MGRFARVFLSLSSALSLSVVAFPAGPANADATSPWTLSPTSVTSPEQPITASGTGCTAAGVPPANLEIALFTQNHLIGYVQVTDTAGDWSDTFTTWDYAHPTDTVGAECINDGGSLGSSSATALFTYDASHTLTYIYELTITNAASLPPATYGQAYSFQLQASGGTGSYSWQSFGSLPAGLTVDDAGLISGIPAYTGTVQALLTVSDTSAEPLVGEATPLVVVSQAGSQPPWQLLYNQGNSGINGGPVVTNPHVAYVPVGTWWCPAYASASPVPKICKSKSLAGSASEQDGFIGALTGLVTRDYNGQYGGGISEFYETTGCGPLGIGCTNTSVGTISLDSFSAPVSPQAVKSAGGIDKTLPSLGFSSSKANTVYVFLYAPNLLSCNPDNPSDNAETTSGNVYANVYLEDQLNACATDPLPSYGTDYTDPVTDFATWATSHEIDEAITDPGNAAGGWLINAGASNGQQIADPCHLRNDDGETGYTDTVHYPYENFTRDEFGTVVSAFVNNQTDTCVPGPATGIPPF